jgi:hypothetical protein
LLLAAPWCFLFTLGRDLTELTAGAFLVWALILLRRERHWGAALLLCLGALTRESVLVSVGGVAVVRLWQLARGTARPGRADAPWLLPPVAFGIWQLICRSVYGTFPLATGAKANLALPFDGMARAVQYWFSDPGRAANLGLQFLLLIGLTASAWPTLRRPTTCPPHERAAWLLWLPYAACQSPYVWITVSEFRTVSDLQVLTAILLVSSPRLPIRQARWAAVGWTVTAARRVYGN